MKDPDHQKRIIVALDKPDASQALELAATLDPALCRVKVGKELFTSAGPSVVESLQKLQFEVFLDLKFHDIPNTVAAAVRVASELGVWMVNVHAIGGERMMAAARNAADSINGKAPLLIAVTVLTSMDQLELGSTGVSKSIDEQVIALATLSNKAGCDGVVCSALEAQLLSNVLPDFLKVTPGIRLAGDDVSDQRRVMTPVTAIQNGADYLVIGRSVTGSKHPVDTLIQINSELRALNTDASTGYV